MTPGTIEAIGAACAVMTVLGALFVYANKLNLAPFKILIASNTMAMEELKKLTATQQVQIDDHQDRIVSIETKHMARHGEFG
jgi:hypothetical protein